MTALKIFSIAANGTPMGIFKAADVDAVILTYVQDGGYKTIEEAATVHILHEKNPDEIAEEIEQIVADWRAEIDVEDLQETYEHILADIRHWATCPANDFTRILNIRREELVKCALDLEDGGLKIDWSGDLDVALAESFYKDSIVDECAAIVAIEDLNEAA